MYIGANKTIEQLNYDAGSTTASTLALSTVLGPSASAASLTFDSSASTPSITISLGAAAHEIGVGTSAGAIGTVILNKDLTINHNGANSLTIDKAITGAHALTLNGSANNGVLILSGANTYSGATTIGSSGVMKLTGGSLGNTAITVNSGTLAVKPGAGTTISAGTTGVGTAGASLNLGANTFDMTDGAISTFNLQQNASFVGTALTIANGATLKFNLGNSTCDVLAVTGSASVSSTPTVTVDVSQATSWTGSPTFNVITAGSGLNSGSWAVSPATVTVGGQLYALSIAATAGAVTVTATPKFSVTYNGNNSDNDLNAPVDGSSPYSSGALVTVLGQGSLTKSGYNFAGWGTSSGGPVVYSWNGSAFSPASFTISANTTLYAQWAAATGPTQVRVETAADGSGSVVSAQNLASGSAITVYAISRTSGGAFVANVAADSWSLVNETGSVVSGDLVPAGDSKSAILTGNAAGTAKIHAVSGSLTSVDSGTITVLIPAAVTVETAADGSGTELAAQNVASGTSVTGYAISRTAGGAFVANVAATWSLANVSGGLVSGDLVAAGDSKSAVFTGHVIGSANIHAVSGALTSTDSGLLTVTFGTASKLAFTTQPSASTVVNAVFATQPVVSLEDQAGNVVTSGADSTVSVALTLSTGTGVLGGTTSVNAVNGVADFAGQGLNISLPGVNKVLTATATITAGTKTATTSPAFTITSLNLTWLGSPASYNWNTADVDWSGGNGGVYLDQASAVTFDDTGSDASPITLVGTLSPTSVTVNTSSRSYSFTGSGKIAGTGTTLTKSGSSTLTVTTANTYTGATILNGGELDATTSAKALGAGALTLSGGGTTLRLANDTGLNYGNNTTVSANMTIQSDVLTLGNPGVIHTNGTMSIGANTLTVAGGANVSSGTAGLTFGTTTLTGSPTFIVNNPSGGGTTLLTLGALTDATGNTIHLQGSGNVVQSAAWAVATGLQLDSTFTGMITLNQNNSGTPAWTGPITINGGTLYATGGGNRMGTGTLYLNGGTLDLSTGSGRAHTRNLTVGGNASILNGPQNHAAGNGATNSLQALSLGAYNLAVSSGLCNSGIEELDFGATTLTGSPTLTINSASAGGTMLVKLAAITDNGNTLTLKGNGNFAQSGVWAAGTPSGGGLTLDATYTGTATLSKANTYTGTTTISGGTLALSGSGSIATTPTITIAPGATFDVSAVTGPGYANPSGRTLAFKINKTGSTLTQGQLAIGGINFTYGGPLNVISNASSSAFDSGDSFTLVSKTTGTLGGWFSSVTLPSLAAGLAWDTNTLQSAGHLDVYSFTATALAFSTASNSAATVPAAKLTSRTSSARAGSAYPTGWQAVASGATLGTVSFNGGGDMIYTPTGSGTGTDNFTVTLYDGYGSQTMAVAATVVASNTGPPLSGTNDGTGHYKITTSGAPGVTYSVQAQTLDGGVWSAWTTITTTAADSYGVVSWTDTEAISAHTGKLYRLAQ